MVNKFKQQCITATTIISSMVNGIVGFIAVYFFKPFWEKIMSLWNKK